MTSSNAREADAPVRVVETGSDHDDLDRPEHGIALCLSGGGYRAMLFHLGAIWRLNELGYLQQLKRVSSVSGGSITIHPGPRRIAVGAAYTGQHATVITTANQAHVFIAGNLIRQLTIDPNKREQPLYPRPGRPPTCPE